MDRFVARRYPALAKPRASQGPAEHVLIAGDGPVALSSAAHLSASGAIVALWRPSPGSPPRQIWLRLGLLLQTESCPVLVLGDESDIVADDWDLVLLSGTSEQSRDLLSTHKWIGESIPCAVMVATGEARPCGFDDRRCLFFGHPGLAGLVDGAKVIDAGVFRFEAALERASDQSSGLAFGLVRRLVFKCGVDVRIVGDLNRFVLAQNALLSAWVAGISGAGGLAELLADASRWAVLCAAQQEVLQLLEHDGVSVPGGQQYLVAAQMGTVRRAALIWAARRPMFRQSLSAMLPWLESTYAPIFAAFSDRLTQNGQRRPYLVRLAD